VFAKIMDDRNGRVVATRTLIGDGTVRKDDAVDVVAGLDAAMSGVLIELVRWTLSAI
jgi:cholesterol transport system auxiliary component